MYMKFLDRSKYIFCYIQTFTDFKVKFTYITLNFLIEKIVTLNSENGLPS